VGSTPFEYPYALLDCNTADGDTIVNAYVDPELGNEAFTYELASGVEDSIHIDHVLEHNCSWSPLSKL